MRFKNLIALNLKEMMAETVVCPYCTGLKVTPTLPLIPFGGFAGVQDTKVGSIVIFNRCGE